MASELKGKKALVTGGGKGIGKAIAIAYARAGMDVAVTGRSKERLTDVITEMSVYGGKVLPVEWDISDVAQTRGMPEMISQQLGGLDVVVNNAGVIGRSDFFTVDETEWDQVMDTNLKGLYFLCQATARFMTEHAISGRIINIASDAGLRGAPVPYGISKWGVIGLTKGLARILLPKGILVNAIAPGPTATEMMRWEKGKPLEIKEHPFGRLAKPEEVAEVAIFLASEASSRIAGDVIVVNGGL